VSAEATASPPSPVPFISYSRNDSPFVRKLHDALAAMGRDIWVDWEDIPPSVDWLERIRNAIVETDAFVFLVSPASAASEVCRTEATLAEGAGKRLIPVVIEPVRASDTPEPIRTRNWLTFDQDDFDGSLARLLEVVDADYDWLEMHTRLGMRAAEWIASGRKGHLALSGPALVDAERWLGEAPRHRDPTVTSDQTELIIGSRRRVTRRLRYVTGLLAGVLATIGVLAILAFIQYQTAEAQRREAVAQREQAVAQRQVATARQLAAQGESLDDQYDLGLLLAVEGSRLSDQPDVYASLLRTVTAKPHIETFLHHDPGQDVYSVAFAPNSTTVATGTIDGSLSLWDRATRTRTSVEAHEGSVRSVAFAGDGRLLVSGGEDGRVMFWDVGAGGLEPRATADGHSALITSIAVTPDGGLAASGGYDGKVALWNPATGDEIGSLSFDGTEITSLAWSPDNHTLAIGTGPGPIVLWDLATAEATGIELTGHAGSPLALAFSPDGSMLASGGLDLTVRRWDPRSGEAIGEPMAWHDSLVSSVAFSPDGTLIASGSWDQAVNLWGAATGELLMTDQHHTGLVTGLAFANDGTLVTGGTDGNAVLLDIREAPRIATAVTDAAHGAFELTASPDGRMLAASGEESVSLWDLATGSNIGDSIPTVDSDVAFAGDGSGVFAPTVRGIELVDPTGTARPTSVDTTAALDVDITSDGSRVVSIEPGEIVWSDLATGSPLHAVAAESATNDAIETMTPDGSTIVTSDGDDGTLSLWSIDSDSRVGDEINPNDEIVVPALSPDGTRLAIARANGAFEVIDLASRQPVGDPLVGHRNAIFSVAFSPDGRLIASSDLDGNIFLWDAATGVRIAGPLPGHTRAVDDVAFSQRGDRLYSVGQDDLLLSWALAPKDLARVACGVASRNLTTEEWARFLGTLPYHETCP
jgi:WD40 repeat protein